MSHPGRARLAPGSVQHLEGGELFQAARPRDATRALLAEISSEDRVRALMPDPAGTDPHAWRQLGELGLPGIAVPERFGGGGWSLVDQGVVLEEMGRALCGGPYFSTAVLAAQTLLAAPDGDPVAAELLGGICAGGLTVTLAVTEAGGRWDEAGVTLQAGTSSAGPSARSRRSSTSARPCWSTSRPRSRRPTTGCVPRPGQRPG
jgi:alkylation response protein AidB-like acyl-CoA dehydrogenase